MKLDYNCTGADRKNLVSVLADHTGQKAKYLGAPSFAYQVDYITIDKNGVLHLDDNADPDWVEAIQARLAASGFTCIYEAYDNPQPELVMDEEPEGISIQMPMTSFTESSLQNLFDLVDAKGNLIKKALGVSDLTVNLLDDRLAFDWFSADSTPEEINAYTAFVTALCEMARNQKRITAKEKDVDNEKYAFRCFLLRLGFIGTEHKQTRKILLRNLSGSSAFKARQKKEVRE